MRLQVVEHDLEVLIPPRVQVALDHRRLGLLPARVCQREGHVGIGLTDGAHVPQVGPAHEGHLQHTRGVRLVHANLDVLSSRPVLVGDRYPYVLWPHQRLAQSVADGFGYLLLQPHDHVDVPADELQLEVDVRPLHEGDLEHVEARQVVVKVGEAQAEWADELELVQPDNQRQPQHGRVEHDGWVPAPPHVEVEDDLVRVPRPSHLTYAQQRYGLVPQSELLEGQVQSHGRYAG